MLTLDTEETTALDYSVVNASIQETFTAIDRFEWQAVDELRVMRDNGYYSDAGYASFEDYCEKELTKHGGYRRVRDLLSAKKVVDILPEELRGKITKPSQTRSLLRLVKTPDKLHEAVAIAAQEKPFPTAADFAKAVQQVAPTKKRATKAENPKTQLCNSVTVSSPEHPRYGESGVISADAPNHWQQIVTFPDGERLLVNNAELDAPREQNYPPEYTEAIAQIKEQHQQELERLSNELRIGLQSEASDRAEEQAKEQIQSLQNLYRQQKEQNIQLQERLDEMEGLRNLEIENQQLRQRIQDLEHAVEQRPSQQWGNTMTQQATKILNKQVKLALEKTIDLRSLAVEPPKENAQECLRLMGMALKNLASAMNNTQALEAAAIILGSEPTPQAIAYRAEQLEMLPQAVTDIRQVLTKPGCTWQGFCAVAEEYEVIKADYWTELSTEETNSCDEKAVHAGEKVNQPGRNQNHPKVEQIHAAKESFQKNGQKSEDLQGFQNPNNVSNYPLTTYQQPTKVVGMVVGSDALARNLRVEETAHAPLRGASPSHIFIASELEELPTANNCTTLTLVDDVQGESALLIGENQDCSVEAIFPHVRVASRREGTYSAAPVAKNEKSLNSAIANQIQGQVEQSNPTSLLAENSVSGGKTKAVNEGKNSAASVPIPEKWSHEAIVARASARPERMQKLKVALNSGQNPGFDFLHECWDDPALQIVIKKLLAKFPQWGIVCVNGVLVKWND